MRITSVAAMGDGRVVLGHDSGEHWQDILTVLNTAYREERVVQAECGVRQLVPLSDSTVLGVHRSGHSMSIINVDRGVIQETGKTTGEITCVAPLADDDVVCFERGGLFRIYNSRTADCQHVWRLDIPRIPGVVFSGCRTHALALLPDGDLAWRFEALAEALSGMAHLRAWPRDLFGIICQYHFGGHLVWSTRSSKPA